MSDNVDSLMLQIQEHIDSGRKIGRQRLVDPQLLQDLLESIRAALPNTIDRAKEIVAKRADILDTARKDAEGAMNDARQRAAESEATSNARVQEVLQRAKDHVTQMRLQGERIVEDAHRDAERLVEEHAIVITAREQSEQMLREARAAAEQIEADSRQHSEQTIGQAQEYSRELLQRAEEWGRQYTTGVRTVVEEIVNEAEEILANSLTDIRGTKKRLQVGLTKSAEPPEFYAPQEPSLF